jgi:hypothetical protein
VQQETIFLGEKYVFLKLFLEKNYYSVSINYAKMRTEGSYCAITLEASATNASSLCEVEFYCSEKMKMALEFLT